MRTEEVNKKVIHYISDDGKDFGEDKEACELYEFENPYVRDMERIPKLENILFFHNRIDAYWCESQEDIDLCCQYFQECKRRDNLMSKKRNEEMNYLDCLCSGRFIYPGYYFIIKLNSSILDSYAMYSIEQMNNLWKVFLSQILAGPKTQKRLEEVENQSKEIAETFKVDTVEEELPTTQKEIFDKIKQNNNEVVVNKSSFKKTPKIYRRENLNEYKSDKENKENETNE